MQVMQNFVLTWYPDAANATHNDDQTIPVTVRDLFEKKWGKAPARNFTMHTNL